MSASTDPRPMGPAGQCGARALLVEHERVVGELRAEPSNAEPREAGAALP